MINEQIMALLTPITQEEQAILNGSDTIDNSIYTEDNNSLISAKKLLHDGKLITVRTHTRFIHFPEHSHDYIECVYMCCGQTTHIINGNEILLKEGELLFLGQNAKQEILPAKTNDIAVNFIILPQFFYKTLEMLGTEETPIKKFLFASLFENENKGFLHFKVAHILPIQNLIENLLFTLTANATNKRNLSQTTMGLLIMQLLNHTEMLTYNSRQEEAMFKIFRYIEENFKSGTLTEAARLFHYDFYWLSHEIKDQTGKTFTELMKEKRLSHAAYLLKNTKIGIEEISNAVGYENKSYFYRIFNSHFGMSPKKFRDMVLAPISF